MNLRTRTVAGVLTLSALTFSFGETVFASMCTTMSGMANSDDMAVEMASMVADEDSTGGSDSTLVSRAEGHSDGDGRDVPCPLTPAVGAGCSAVASLPSAQIATAAWTNGTSPGHPSEDARRDLLLTHGLFRPPRA